MGRHQVDATQQAAWRSLGKRPSRPHYQWHLLVLRSGAPWRDLPEAFGPYTTCYNRFVRWRRAGVWRRVIDALAAAHDAAVQMIDASIVRVRQQGATTSSPPITLLCRACIHPAMAGCALMSPRPRFSDCRKPNATAPAVAGDGTSNRLARSGVSLAQHGDESPSTV